MSKSSLILIIGSGINQFLVLLVGLFSARYLGPHQYGIITLASSINVIFIFFLELGFHHYITRQIARDFSTISYYYSGILWLKIIILLPFLVFVYCFMSILRYDSLIVNVTLITTSAFILNSFVYSFYSLIQAHSDMRFISIGYITNGLIIFIGFSLSIFLQASIYAFVLIPVFANSLLLIYALITVNLKYHLHLQNIAIVKSFTQTHLKQALPFGLTGLFVTMYLWSGSFWISIFHSEELVGYFNASFKIVFASFTVSQGINMTMYPLLSNVFMTDRLATKKLFHNQIKIMAISSITISFFLLILSNSLIQFLLGAQYSKSIIILQLLVFTVPFVFIRSAFERFLEITGNQIKVTISYAFGAIFGFFLNILLIYYFAIVGASIAIILTDIIIFCVTLYQTTRLDL